MGGGGQSTNTVQSATPWSGVQPGLLNLYGQGANLCAQGGPQVYPGAMVQPLNAPQSNALNSMINMGLNGGVGQLNPYQNLALGTTAQIAQGNDAWDNLLNTYANGGGLGNNGLEAIINGNATATQGLGNIISGQGPAAQGLGNIISGNNLGIQQLQSMMGSNYTNVANNPNLQSAMNAANYNTAFNFNNAVMPQLASQFSAAGRFGSGAQTEGINQATNNLASQISNTNAGMAESTYQTLLGNQLTAAQALPQLQGAAANELGQLQGTAASNLGAMQNQAASSLNSNEMAAAGLFNNRQGAALQLLPGLATQGYGNAQMALGAGNQFQQQAQNQL